MTSIPRKNADAIAVANSQIFVHDQIGANNNSVILQYAKDCGFAGYLNDDIAWCALFMNWVLLQINIKGTQSLAARSFLTFGTDVVGEPVVGDIAVFWRDSIDSAHGHVTFFLNSVMRDNVKYLRVLGGNQGDQVRISEFPASQLLQFRRIIEH